MTVQQFMTWVANDLRNVLVQTAPVSDGFLKNNINVKMGSKGIEVFAPEYALYVEYGTGGRLQGQTSTVGGKTVNISPKMDRKMPVKKDGTKFVSLLEDWGRRKLGIITEQDQWRLAKHIQMYGTRPHPFIRNALYHALPKILKEKSDKYLGGAEVNLSW